MNQTGQTMIFFFLCFAAAKRCNFVFFWPNHSNQRVKPANLIFISRSPHTKTNTNVEFLFTYFVSKYWQDKSFKLRPKYINKCQYNSLHTQNRNNLQHLKLGNLKLVVQWAERDISYFGFPKNTKTVQSQVMMKRPFINNCNLFYRESLMTFIKMELYGTILLVITPNLMSVRILINFWTLSGHP